MFTAQKARLGIASSLFALALIASNLHATNPDETSAEPTPSPSPSPSPSSDTSAMSGGTPSVQTYQFSDGEGDDVTVSTDGTTYITVSGGPDTTSYTATAGGVDSSGQTTAPALGGQPAPAGTANADDVPVGGGVVNGSWWDTFLNGTQAFLWWMGQLLLGGAVVLAGVILAYYAAVVFVGVLSAIAGMVAVLIIIGGLYLIITAYIQAIMYLYSLICAAVTWINATIEAMLQWVLDSVGL